MRCSLCDQETADEPRPTVDVDCTLEITSRLEHRNLEAELRSLGFEYDTSEGAPICRWVYHGIAVDVMPSEESILGFSSRWYKPGIEKKEERTLSDGMRVYVLPLAYFVATKIDAYNSRGREDPRTSSDIEDIIYVLDGHSDPLVEIENADRTVSLFVRREFDKLTKHALFQDAMEGFFVRDRAKRLLRIQDMALKLGAG